MGWPRKIRIADSLMFIMDDNFKIFVYQQDGTFVNTIGTIGKGPNELQSITNFYINEKERYIGVMDPVGLKMVRHTFEGTPLKTFSLDRTAWQMIQDIDMIDEEHILTTYTNGPLSPNQYALVSEDDYSLMRYLLPHITIGKDNCGNAYIETFAQSGGKWYAPEMLSDTLYAFQGNKLIPRCILDFGIKHPNPEVIREDEPYPCARSMGGNTLRKKGYSTGIDRILPAGKYLYFQNFALRIKYDIFLDPEKGTGFYFEEQENRNIFHSLDQFKTWNGSEMVCVIPVNIALHEQEGEYALSHPKVLEVMRQCKEEDNPIIGFYKVPEPK
jgi:hypothetical protein